MKKGFTLVEMIVVILILWIMFSVFWILSWSYIQKLTKVNDIETIKWAFSFAMNSSFSQPIPNEDKEMNFDFVAVRMDTDSNNIDIVWFTGNSNIMPDQIYSIEEYQIWRVHSWTGWTILKETSEEVFDGYIYFLYEPYRSSYTVVKWEAEGWEGRWEVLTGYDYQISFDIYDPKNDEKSWCFLFYATNGRIDQIKCE